MAFCEFSNEVISKNFITIDGDDVNYCSDHFAIYILCSVPKINIELYVNYTSV